MTASTLSGNANALVAVEAASLTAGVFSELIRGLIGCRLSKLQRASAAVTARCVITVIIAAR